MTDDYSRGAAKLNCSTFPLLLPTSALAIAGLTCISSAFYSLSAAVRAGLLLLSFCTYLHH